MDTLPSVLGSTELVNLLDSMINSYKDTKINAEIQKTEREKIIQQARVFIAQYENDTKKAICEIKRIEKENLEMIQLIGKLLERPDLDDNCVTLCEIILKNLR